jgi:oligoendopeptidase F
MNGREPGRTGSHPFFPSTLVTTMTMTTTETTSETLSRFASYEPRGWDLSELLPEPSEGVIAARLSEMETAASVFEARRNDLHPGMEPAAFLEILHQYEQLVERMSTISGYASLWFYADTSNQQALTFRNRVRQAITAADNRILFFTLWWRGLSDEEAEPLLPQGEESSDALHYLRDLRRLKPHTLDEKSEQLINLKDENGIAAVMTLYSMLTNRLEFTLEVDGETKTLTRDALMSYAFSPRPELRAAAYQELYRVYAGDAAILGQIYVNRVRDWHDEHVGLRGHRSPISVRNLDNDIPDRAVEVLLEVSRENAPIFQRYFRMKAGWLGLDRLRRYDIYAPLATSDREIPYSEGVRSVLETFQDFHPRFAAMADRVFSQNHVDSAIRKGKRGGAFCSTVLPSLTPWVLVNYSGRVRDVATLAHELGHAVHSMLAEDHSILTQHASLPLAETASVFGEMLMTDRLLREESDPLARRELLAAAVDDVYATVLRQAYFVLFEKDAHEAILAGRSVEEVSELYMSKLVEQFGDSVELAPEFRYEWLSIPHIYQTPFYCYAYSFGQLLVLALYRRFQEEGEAFKPGYLRLLSYGGSARPEAILKEVGIDMTDPAFWQGGFDLVRERIDELEGMEL